MKTPHKLYSTIFYIRLIVAFVFTMTVLYCMRFVHGWPSKQLSQPAHNRTSRSTQPGKLQTNWWCVNASIRHQADFVHLCNRGTIVIEALFIMRVRHTLGKANNCIEYSKGKNGICKHAWQSKPIGAVVRNANSIVRRGLSLAHLCSVVCSVCNQTTRLARRYKPRAWYRAQEFNWICFQWFYLTVEPILISGEFRP